MFILKASVLIGAIILFYTSACRITSYNVCYTKLLRLTRATASMASGRKRTWGQYDPGNYEMVIQYPHRSFIAPRVKATVDHLLKHFENDATLHIPLEKLANFAYQE